MLKKVISKLAEHDFPDYIDLSIESNQLQVLAKQIENNHLLDIKTENNAELASNAQTQLTENSIFRELIKRMIPEMSRDDINMVFKHCRDLGITITKNSITVTPKSTTV